MLLSMESELGRLLGFVKLTNQFRATKRTIRAVGEDRNENDSEHSYQLAMLAWYLITSERLTLDLDRVIRYCLTHDLPEAYVGDVDRHIADPETKRLKEAREAEAVKCLVSDYPEFPEIVGLIREYEDGKEKDVPDEEHPFVRECHLVYALDKIQPALNILQGGGEDDYYKRNSITRQKWEKHNKEKIAKSPVVQRYFESLIPILEGMDLFAKDPEEPDGDLAVLRNGSEERRLTPG